MSRPRWTKEKAARWALNQPWWVGCNFTPSTACNQLEMWQADTFDAETIARELGWAADLGMNSVRVFLHDLVWQADTEGFKSRIEQFLTLADSVGIKTMFVLFDDCWFPPTPGPQDPPIPGMHNSRWAQSPGHNVVSDRSQWERLEAYVRDVVGTFGQDHRVFVWDLYNEPGNAILPLASQSAYRAIPPALASLFRHFVLPSPSLPLVQSVFDWARAVTPAQPLTVGVWAPNPRLNSLQFAQSDIISFHQYLGAKALKKRITSLRHTHQRPILCTEWMARPFDSRITTHLPVFKEQQVGCFCWGLVSGRTQTMHSWRDRPGTPPPKIWHHDVLHPDGSPFDLQETEMLKRLTAR